MSDELDKEAVFTKAWSVIDSVLNGDTSVDSAQAQAAQFLIQQDMQREQNREMMESNREVQRMTLERDAQRDTSA